MITDDPQLILDALAAGSVRADSPAVPSGVFMVEPVDFRLSLETATDNRYMAAGKPVDADRALEQYIRLLAQLRAAGIAVKSFPGHPDTPDNVFPNNVFATAPGRLIIGHPRHPQRQAETRRSDIRDYFRSRGYATVDLSAQDCVAELTGPLVIDRARRLGFCGMTSRVDQAGLQAMHQAFGLRHTLHFELKNGEYHTNVVMSVLASRACVLHARSFADAKVPYAIASMFGGRVLYLDQAEKDAFAANCIALTANDLFMSQTASDALQEDSRALLKSWGFRIHAAELDEIEKAGGSLRCMVAEIF
jgi:hypothetical protein